MTTKKETVLIIDDEPEMVDLIKMVLDYEGYETFRGVGGAKGLRRASKVRPDLVLLDIMMPDIDGYEVLEQIKEREIPTRVIMVTALEGLEHVVRLVKAGACDYITKPFDPEELVNAVKRALVLETTINLRLTESAPIIRTLLAKAEELEQGDNALREENAKLRERHRSLEKRQPWIKLSIRLLCLVASALITVLFYSLRVITSSQSLFLLPIVLLILLLLPVERVKNLYAKIRQAETRIEMSSDEE